MMTEEIRLLPTNMRSSSPEKGSSMLTKRKKGSGLITRQGDRKFAGRNGGGMYTRDEFEMRRVFALDKRDTIADGLYVD